MLLIGRDPVTGVMSDLDEILFPHAGMTNKTSMSMLRTPGPLNEWVRGSASNVPFWPGGMETMECYLSGISDLISVDDTIEELDFKKDCCLKTVPLRVE